MIAYKELQDVLRITVDWEKKLNDLYDVAEFGVKKSESKEAIYFLKEKQLSNIEILSNIKVENYGPTEWVKFAFDYKENELIPAKDINKESSASEIFDYILEYEEKLRSFYDTITGKVVSERQKDLFGSLVRFKEDQINRIRNYMRANL
jgi:hypothetical protein